VAAGAAIGAAKPYAGAAGAGCTGAGAAGGRRPSTAVSAAAYDSARHYFLITARQWGQNYEWQAHRPLAEKAGLKPEIAQAVADGRRPSGMAADEEIVFDFCSELHANKSVSDATYQRALEKFGEQGIIDLTAVNGYYSFNAMILNVARTALPANVKAELQPFPR